MFQGFENIKRAQQIADDCYRRLLRDIRPGMTEKEIKKMAEMNLVELGSFSFWRYGIGATVFLGERSTLSQSSRNYYPAEVPLGENDVVWVDLAPSDRFYWGDFSRTIVVQNGKAEIDISNIADDKYRRTMEVQQEIHDALRTIARPDMTFHMLHEKMDTEVRAREHENLDFSGNYGHSVELRSEDRRVIVSGCYQKLSECDCFTFEPHIRAIGSDIGMKWENIYYFDNNGIVREIRE